jgi:hypothetical protein
MTVGAAALDAAEQARRAAKLAESASAAMLDARRQRDDPARAPARTTGLAGARPRDESLRAFTERADRIAARLQQIVRLPLPGSPELRGARSTPRR